MLVGGGVENCGAGGKEQRPLPVVGEQVQARCEKLGLSGGPCHQGENVWCKEQGQGEDKGHLSVKEGRKATLS